MKTLILLLLPLFALSQKTDVKLDTLKAVIKLKQGINFTKNVMGYVVVQRDSCSCKPVEYLRIKQELFGNKYELLPFPAKFTVVDYRLAKTGSSF